MKVPRESKWPIESEKKSTSYSKSRTSRPRLRMTLLERRLRAIKTGKIMIWAMQTRRRKRRASR